jgi:Flp pilus assembly protein TadB
LTGAARAARLAAFNHPMDDEKYYQTVAEELRANRINDALWTKAIAKSQGDENKTKAMYIQLRVEQLVQEEKRSKLARTEPGEGREDESEDAAVAAPGEQQKVVQWIVAAVLILVIAFVVKNWLWPKLHSYL